MRLSLCSQSERHAGDPSPSPARRIRGEGTTLAPSPRTRGDGRGERSSDRHSAEQSLTGQPESMAAALPILQGSLEKTTFCLASINIPLLVRRVRSVLRRGRARPTGSFPTRSWPSSSARLRGRNSVRVNKMNLIVLETSSRRHLSSRKDGLGAREFVSMPRNGLPNLSRRSTELGVFSRVPRADL